MPTPTSMVPHVQRLHTLAAHAKRRIRTAVRRRVAPGYGIKANHELANIPIPAEVIAYFPDAREKLYQIEQWLPVLEQLDAIHPVLIVTRNVYTTRELRKRTGLRAIFVRRFHDLMELYDTGDYKAAIYVNHGVQNFQSLSAQRVIHIHVNHGESDKLCNVSNQVKAYDYIFVAGDAAVDRHRAALMHHDLNKLVKTGRPQLDLTFDPVLPPSDRRTLLYAPTWEGENAANNYTSVDMYGPDIIEAMLAVPHSRVIYRPHPQIPNSRTAEVRTAHERILELLETASANDPDAGHAVSTEGSVIALFDQCDLLATDVSSVGVDFLYRHSDRPMFLTDRRDDPDQLVTDSPVAAGADRVSATTLSTLATMLEERMDRDPLREERLRMRNYYFGDLAVGDSTTRFLNAVDSAITERDRLLEGQPIVRMAG